MSVRLDVRELDHVRPLLGFVAHELAEFCRGHRHRVEAQAGKPLLGGRLCDDGVDYLGELVGDSAADPPAFFELIFQRLRNFVRRAVHNDRIERRDFRPALKSIAHFHMRVLVIESRQAGRRIFGKRLDDLDRLNIFHQFGQDSGLITAAGSDFENTVGRLRPQLLGHEPDDEWL